MALGAGYTQSGRRIALWIHVDEQDGQAGNRERGGEVDRRCGLTDATFLVRHGQDNWFSDDRPPNELTTRRGRHKTALIVPFAQFRNGQLGNPQFVQLRLYRPDRRSCRFRKAL